jgi:hypothetical protein
MATTPKAMNIIKQVLKKNTRGAHVRLRVFGVFGEFVICVLRLRLGAMLVSSC